MHGGPRCRAARRVLERRPALHRHLFIQVGGGALASGAIQALMNWAQLRGGALPHVHAVQTARVPTLARGFAAAVARAAEGSAPAVLPRPSARGWRRR